LNASRDSINDFSFSGTATMIFISARNVHQNLLGHQNNCSET
jgi:hypothetical protein